MGQYNPVPQSMHFHGSSGHPSSKNTWWYWQYWSRSANKQWWNWTQSLKVCVSMGPVGIRHQKPNDNIDIFGQKVSKSNGEIEPRAWKYLFLWVQWASIIKNPMIILTFLVKKCQKAMAKLNPEPERLRFYGTSGHPPSKTPMIILTCLVKKCQKAMVGLNPEPESIRFYGSSGQPPSTTQWY